MVIEPVELFIEAAPTHTSQPEVSMCAIYENEGSYAWPYTHTHTHIHTHTPVRLSPAG